MKFFNPQRQPVSVPSSQTGWRFLAVFGVVACPFVTLLIGFAWRWKTGAEFSQAPWTIRAPAMLSLVISGLLSLVAVLGAVRLLMSHGLVAIFDNVHGMSRASRQTFGCVMAGLIAFIVCFGNVIIAISTPEMEAKRRERSQLVEWEREITDVLRPLAPTFEKEAIKKGPVSAVIYGRALWTKNNHLVDRVFLNNLPQDRMGTSRDWKFATEQRPVTILMELERRVGETEYTLTDLDTGEQIPSKCLYHDFALVVWPQKSVLGLVSIRIPALESYSYSRPVDPLRVSGDDDSAPGEITPDYQHDDYVRKRDEQLASLIRSARLEQEFIADATATASEAAAGSESQATASEQGQEKPALNADEFATSSNDAWSPFETWQASGNITAACLSRGGGWLACATMDPESRESSIEVWNTWTKSRHTRLQYDGGGIIGLQFCPGRGQLLCLHQGHSLSLFDWRKGQHLYTQGGASTDSSPDAIYCGLWRDGRIVFVNRQGNVDVFTLDDQPPLGPRLVPECRFSIGQVDAPFAAVCVDRSNSLFLRKLENGNTTLFHWTYQDRQFQPRPSMVLKPENVQETWNLLSLRRVEDDDFEVAFEQNAKVSLHYSRDPANNAVWNLLELGYDDVQLSDDGSAAAFRDRSGRLAVTRWKSTILSENEAPTVQVRSSSSDAGAGTRKEFTILSHDLEDEHLVEALDVDGNWHPVVGDRITRTLTVESERISIRATDARGAARVHEEVLATKAWKLIDAYPVESNPPSPTARAFAPSPQGGIFAILRDEQTIEIWDYRKKAPIHLLRHSEPVRSIVYSPSGDKLGALGEHAFQYWVMSERPMAVSPDREMLNSLRDAIPPRRGKLKLTPESFFFEQPKAMGFAKDKRFVAIELDNLSMLRMRDAKGKLLASLPSKYGSAVIAVSDAVELIAVGSHRFGAVEFYDQRNVRPFAELIDSRSMNSAATGPSPPGGPANVGEELPCAVTGLAWSHDGKRLAIAGDFGVAFTPSPVGENRWVGTKPLETRTTTQPRDARIVALAYSSSSDLVVAIDATGALQIWDALRAVHLATFAAKGAPAVGAVFAPGDRGVMSYHVDGRIRLWRNPENP